MEYLCKDTYGKPIYVGMELHWISKAGKETSVRSKSVYEVESEWSKHTLCGGTWWWFVDLEDMEEFIDNGYKAVTIDF